MSNVKKIFTLFIIFIMLFNPVLAADTGQQKEKVIDDTKEKETKITNKDKSIVGDIKVTTKDVSKFSVKKKSNYEISISKSGEHAKAKVSFPKSELQKIDIDGDGKFGLLHISDNGEVTHTTATEAELVAGKVMTFSTNIVNGYSGYKQYTFNSVTSGQTLNINDVSGNYTVAVSVDGVVPTYTAIVETNISTYPDYQNMVAGYNLPSTTDISGNGHTLTNTGTTTTVDRFGTSTCSNFSGTQYLSATGTNKLNITENITVAMFVKRNARGYGTYQRVFGKHYDTYHFTFWNTNYFELNAGNLSNTHLRSTNTITDENWHFLAIKRNYSTSKFYTTTDATTTFGGTVTKLLRKTSSPLSVGVLRPPTDLTQYFKGRLDELYIYNVSLSNASLKTLYAGGSGISFQPEPSYNFTGYNVASGVEKVINTDSTCTGIEYVDTTGGTHDVTVTVYFTEDTTLISDTHTATMQTVNISHTSSNTAQDGELIPYDILDEYFGTIDFDTTNPNATITRNATDFMVDTGYITANTTYYYNVSIPNYVEEMLWSDWNPDNETCNAKVQIGNSTPYTTWVFNLTNVTNSNAYNLRYTNSTLIASATAVNNTAIITATGLLDGTYWITETGGFSNIHFVVGIAFVGGIFVLAAGAFSNQRRKRNQ